MLWRLCKVANEDYLFKADQTNEQIWVMDLYFVPISNAANCMQAQLTSADFEQECKLQGFTQESITVLQNRLDVRLCSAYDNEPKVRSFDIMQGTYIKTEYTLSETLGLQIKSLLLKTSDALNWRIGQLCQTDFFMRSIMFQRSYISELVEVIRSKDDTILNLLERIHDLDTSSGGDFQKSLVNSVPKRYLNNRGVQRFSESTFEVSLDEINSSSTLNDTLPDIIKLLTSKSPMSFPEIPAEQSASNLTTTVPSPTKKRKFGKIRSKD